MRRSSLILLIVIFVVPVTLFSSAVLKMRGAAGRTQCSDHLKQLGCGLHNFHGAHNKMPLAIATPTVDLPTEHCMSWWVELLPQMEQWGKLPIDLSKPWYAHENRLLADAEIWYALCPAGDAKQAEGRWLTHYVAVLGVGKDSGSRPVGDPTRGAMSFRHQATFDDVKDGLSNTIFVAETNYKNGCWIAGGYPTARGLDPEGPHYLGRNGQFGCHPNSAIVGMADGSVRGISYNMSPRVFEALATIAGGEKVNLDD